MRAAAGPAGLFLHPENGGSLTNLLGVPSVFRPNVLANIFDTHTVFMHFSRVQRDVLAHRSAGAMLIREAKEITLMAVAFLAAAVALHLIQDFRNFFGYLIGLSRLAREHFGRQRWNLQRRELLLRGTRSLNRIFARA